MNEKELSELKEYVISTINYLYKDSDKSKAIAIIGDISSCKKVANAFGQGNMINSITDKEDTNVKLEYVSVDIEYDEYTIRFICSNKMNHANNIYIVPCDRV